MDSLGAMLLVLFLFFSGCVIGHLGASSAADQRCEKGEPVVINAKIYRCVEQQR